MGLFRSLFNRAKNAANEAGERLADPIADEKVDISDTKEKIRAFTRSLAELNTTKKRADADLGEAVADRKKWDGYAKLAGEKYKAKDKSKNWKDLCLSSASKVATADAKIADLKETIKRYDVQLTKLNRELEKARNAIAARESSLQSNVARLKAAKITKSLNETAMGLTADGSATLDERVKQAEAEAASYEEMGKDDEAALEEAFGAEDQAADKLAAGYLS